MTQQEENDLLTEARKRYPIGTVFVPLFGGKDKLTVTGNIFLHPFGDRRIIAETDKGDGRATGLINSAVIYTHSGDWAEIISTPEETMIEGQWYIAVNKKDHSKWLFKYSVNGFGKAEGNNTEFSKCIDLESKSKSLNNWIGSNKNYTISKVTNLEEVYLHFPEERPKEKKKYTISELKYPIAIHITSKEQYDKVRKVIKLIVQKFCNKNYSYQKSKDGCIRLLDGTYWSISDKETIQKEGYTVISFNDFKKEYLKEFMDNFDKPVKEDEPKFEAGKWYKSNHHSNSKNHWYYLKVTDFRNGILNGEKISKNSDTGEYMYKKKSYWNAKETLAQVIKLGPLTDLSEIQQYLPDGHEDKIMEPKKQSLKGRYLKALVDSPSGISRAKKGDYFRIDDEYRNSCTLLKNNTSHWYCTSDFSFELMPEDFNPNSFVLPEKWYVIGNKENAQVLNKWICEKRNDLNYAYLSNKSYFYSDYTYSLNELKLDYKEITFEQFKDHVLGKEQKKSIQQTIKPINNEVNLIIPKKLSTLNTKVDKINSVSVNLIQEKKVIYF